MNDLTPFTPLDGGCRCGAVRFRLEAAPIITHSCHCRFCQKVSGAPFRTNAMIETEHLTILAGAPQPFHGRDCMKTLRCPSCEITLWCHHPHLGDVIALVGVGTLDEGERLPILAIRDEVARMAKQRALLKAKRIDRAERPRRHFGFLESELLLNVVRERRVRISVADTQTPRDLTHGRLFVLRRRFGDTVKRRRRVTR